MDDIERLARRFHQVHERLHASRRADGLEMPWEDMTDSYRRRLLDTWEYMTREGSVIPGAGLRFHEGEQLPSSLF